MTRIAYHTDSFARKSRYGLARYSHSLRTALTAQGMEVIPFSSESDFDGTPPAWLSQAGFRRLPLPRKILAASWSLAGAPDVARFLPPFDVLHSVDVDYAAPGRKPWVVTIHDLGCLSRPAYFSNARPALLRAFLRRIGRRADKVICVSTSTAQEVRAFVPQPLGDRLVVIPEGVDEAFHAEPAADAEAAASAIVAPDRPFMVMAGSLNPRKNVGRTLRAFLSLEGRIPHRLVVIGSTGWDSLELEGELQAAEARGAVILPGYVSDAVLIALLHRADAFLYPSLYEGFGLPILEAMAAGCPVVTATNSSLPEVAGDCALLVEAEDGGAIARAIERIATDLVLASELRAKGRARARKFPWSRAATETIAVYKSLA